MNITDFFKMEEKHALFDIKTDQGIYVWDIFRYYVHWYQTVETNKQDTTQKKHITLLKLISIIFLLTKSMYSFLFKRRENILFAWSRFPNENNRLYDIVSNDIIEELKDNILIVEKKKSSKKYEYNSEFNYVIIFKKFFPVKKLPTDIYDQMREAIIETFGVLRIAYDTLNALYANYQKEYIYYRLYLKWKKPKCIFFINADLQKGLIAAAQSLHIPIFELQHSCIDIMHTAYSYPDSVKKHDKRIIIEDALLTLGTYWGRGFNIPTQLSTIGNNYFAKTGSIEPKDNSVLFISSIIYGKMLSQVALQYARQHPDIHIKYRLHNNEYGNEKDYLNMFSATRNISVLKNEISLQKLIVQANLVVLINSTVLYEALQTGAKVAIYKVQNYDSQSACFSFANVFLFDTIDELSNAYMAETKENKACFFEPFNKENFYTTINKLQI
jgi:hypothetical protein